MYSFNGCPQESIYEVPSLGEINTQDDVLNIQISDVQGAASDHKANKHERMTVNQRIENHVDKLRNPVMQSTLQFGTQEKVPLTEGLPGGQLSKHMITQEKRHPVETDVRSPVNQSGILDGEPLSETAKQRKELSFQLNSHERVPSYHLSHQREVSQMSNQYPSPACQMNVGSMSAYQVNTQGPLCSDQNSASESVSVSVYTSSPISYMGTQEEMPSSQLGNFEKNTLHQANYHTEMSTYHGGYNSRCSQQTMPFSQTETHDLTSNYHRSSHTCNCSSRAHTSDYSASGLEIQRPSVIMVPVNSHNTGPCVSHVPFKVNTTSLRSENPQLIPQDFANRMDYSDDSDSSSDDESGKPEKYFRRNIDGTTVKFKLTKEDWSRMPINTFPSGGRLLSGDWTKIFLSKVKESNPWCSFRFKNNHVRSENSRKIFSAAFFRGGAECKRPECNVKVRFVIQKEKGKYVDVTYVGDLCHNSQPGGRDDTKRKKLR